MESVSSDQCVVSIKRGASFGGGEHPSTRLAIQLIDFILHQSYYQGKKKNLNAIDIGTGSGILAIVAAKLGVGCVRGIDTDPISIFEAKENLLLNHVEDRVDILPRDLESTSGSFNLVFANLRAPTLFSLREQLERRVAHDGILVFSGLKADEIKQLCSFYKKSGFLPFQKRSEKDWCAICLRRGFF
jgi:ribosomal protein L11 methyltransferase